MAGLPEQKCSVPVSLASNIRYRNPLWNTQEVKDIGKERCSFGQDKGVRAFGILKHQKTTNIQGAGLRKRFFRLARPKGSFQIQSLRISSAWNKLLTSGLTGGT